MAKFNQNRFHHRISKIFTFSKSPHQELSKNTNFVYVVEFFIQVCNNTQWYYMYLLKMKVFGVKVVYIHLYRFWFIAVYVIYPSLTKILGSQNIEACTYPNPVGIPQILNNFQIWIVVTNLSESGNSLLLRKASQNFFYRQIVFESNVFKWISTILPNFWTVSKIFFFCIGRDFQKKRKEKKRVLPNPF